MKCLSCDVTLTAFEATRKYDDGTFVDLCNTCWFQSDMYLAIPVVERDDLLIKYEDIYDEDSVLGTPP